MENEIVVENKSKQINIIMDMSVLNTFEKCPTLMKYQYLDNYRFKGGKSTALEKGDLLHLPLKYYYKLQQEGVEWKDRVKVGVEKILKYAPKLKLDQKDIEDVMTTFMSYCEFYRYDRWQPVEVESPFRIVVYEDAELRIILQGRIDLIVDTGQLLIPVDHKSESRRSEPVELNNQFMAYCYAAKANNIIINKIGFQKSLKAEDKYYRKMMSYDDDNLEEWKMEFVFKVRELLGYAEINYFPHRYTSCQDKYGMCVFHEVCHTHRAARDYKLNSQFEINPEPWDPFKNLEDEE